VFSLTGLLEFLHQKSTQSTSTDWIVIIIVVIHSEKSKHHLPPDLLKKS